jgi:phosphoglycerate kinase
MSGHTARATDAKKNIRDLPDLQGKKVLVRVDFNVPLDKSTGNITNDRRIKAALPTIQYLLDQGAAVVAMSHLGRPKGDPALDAPLRMDKIAAHFGGLLDRPVKKAADEVIGPEARAAALALKSGEVLLLENLRFDAREQKNDTDFAHAIAALGDMYVNDAFGTCHNDNDASMVGVPAAMKGKPRVLGFLVAKELEVIDGLMSNPKRPLLGIMGGAKVSDKVKFIHALLDRVDHLLIGGKMTYTFMKALGVSVGNMQIDDKEVAAVRPLLGLIDRSISLPVDSLCAKSDDLKSTQVVDGAIPAGYEGVDIGPKTLTHYSNKIRLSATVIWNGPVGWFEKPAFSNGTKGIAQAMAESGAVTVVGGGETAEAVEQFGFDSKMTHVSTGGGAFLAYVEGKKFASLGQIDDS